MSKAKKKETLPEKETGREPATTAPATDNAAPTEGKMPQKEKKDNPGASPEGKASVGPEGTGESTVTEIGRASCRERVSFAV